MSRQNSRLQVACRAITNALHATSSDGEEKVGRHRLRAIGAHVSRCVSARRSPVKASNEHLLQHTHLLLTNGQTTAVLPATATTRLTRRPRSRSFDRVNVNNVQVLLPTTKLNGVATKTTKPMNGCELYTVLIQIDRGGASERPKKAAVAIFDEVPLATNPQSAHARHLRRTRSMEAASVVAGKEEARVDLHRQLPTTARPPVARASSGRTRELVKHNSSSVSIASAPIKPAVISRPPETEGLRVHVHHSATDKARKKTQKDENKAAKTLSAILLAFVVTWLPYNVIVCLFASGVAVPAWLWTSSYYL